MNNVIPLRPDPLHEVKLLLNDALDILSSEDSGAFALVAEARNKILKTIGKANGEDDLPAS